MARCISRRLALGFGLLLFVGMAGCGDKNPPAESAGPENAGPNETAAPENVSTAGAHEDARPATSEEPHEPEVGWRYQDPEEGRSLGDLLDEAEAAAAVEPPLPQELPPLPEIDEERVAAAGIRKVEGEHLILYTDLPVSQEIADLPVLFDAAVPLWCEYFEVPTERAAEWKIVGSLMQDEEKFRTAGLLPEDLPEFLNGYQLGAQLWLYEQPSDYYRRHLLLHEGTHGFMNNLLGGCGPPWYMEGMAEWLGTHRWENGHLWMGYMPGRTEEVPEWGRVKIIGDEVAAGRAMSLPEVMNYGPTAHLQNEPYAWCWAACTFLEMNPMTHERFRALRSRVQSSDFNLRFRESLAEDWPAIAEQWQLFVLNMQYGYNVAAEAIHYAPGQPVPEEGVELTIDVGKGWQSSGYTFEERRRYLVTAEGRYTIANTGQPWPCEPNGVTIRYYKGMPLGILIGSMRPDDWQDTGLTPLATPGMIGLRLTIEPNRTSTLYLRVNDWPSELGDNDGQCRVRIVPQPAAAE